MVSKISPKYMKILLQPLLIFFLSVRVLLIIHFHPKMQQLRKEKKF